MQKIIAALYRSRKSITQLLSYITFRSVWFIEELLHLIGQAG